MKKIYVLLATVLVLFASCSKDSGTVTSESIFPNYSDVVIPVNIAPLNFMVSGAEKVKVNISGTSEYSFSNRAIARQLYASMTDDPICPDTVK